MCQSTQHPTNIPVLVDYCDISTSRWLFLQVSQIINKLFLIFLLSQMDRYVLFSDYTFMKYHDIFFNFFFRLTHKAFLMPWACPGTSMYYALRHAVFTSAFDIFLCSIICTSTTIIFIFWNFFHILYFETLPLPYYFCVILFANLLTSWVKKYADYGNPHISC